MPTAEHKDDCRTVLLHGLAGRGKSNLAACSPQPHAVLCVDRPSVVHPIKGTPGYDPSQTFWTTYQEVLTDVDLAKGKQDPTKNIADHILADLMALKTAMMRKEAEVKIKSHLGDEIWPLPRTIIVEGADFIVRHIESWLCATHKKPSMAEWAKGEENRWFPYQLRALKLQPIYDLLTFLPSAHLCNVVVTTGLDEEEKQERINGKLETIKTGKIDPELGGKFSRTMPRNFNDCFLCTVEADKWWVVTQPTGRYTGYRGIRSSEFLPAMRDMTIDPKNPTNLWDKLFGN